MIRSKENIKEDQKIRIYSERNGATSDGASKAQTAINRSDQRLVIHA